MSLVLRTSETRRFHKSAQSSIWQTFYPTNANELPPDGFADLLRFDEIHIPPSGTVPESVPHGDSFTYIHHGAITQRNPRESRMALAGDFQSTSTRMAHSETNASSSAWAQIFRLSIAHGRSESDFDEAHRQERFTASERRNTRCLVASSSTPSTGNPKQLERALPLRSNAHIYSSIIEMGHHIVHALEPQRSTWLHLVSGRVTVNTHELSKGDGIGFHSAPSISIAAREESEILLVEMGSRL